MKYTAVYAPNPFGGNSKSGFDSESEAEKHISKFLCKGCLRDVLECPDTESAILTNCGAEWFIISDEDWSSYEKSGDFSFLMEAAGYVKIDPKET